MQTFPPCLGLVETGKQWAQRIANMGLEHSLGLLAERINKAKGGSVGGENIAVAK